MTFLAFAGVEVPPAPPFLLSAAVTLAFLTEAAAVVPVPVVPDEVAEWLLSIEIRLISDLSDLVEESVSRLLRFAPLLVTSS